MQLLRSPSPASSPKPLSSKTNAPPTRSLKVHFKLPVIRKASPTVSVTNTNAARASTALSTTPETDVSMPEVPSPTSNSIAFPSSPIPCPSRKRALSEDGYDPPEVAGDRVRAAALEVAAGLQGNALPFHRRISHIDILRRRSKSCLASSYFHSDSTLPRSKPLPPPSQPFPTEDVDMLHEREPAPEPPVKRRPGARRESMSAGNPSNRTIRKARRVVADAQFLASMHSSIALRVRTRVESGASTPRGPDECAAQDELLVERIWHTLVDMGYKPVPLDSTSPSPTSAPSSPTSAAFVPVPSSPSPSPSKSNGDAAREAADRAARRTRAASSPSFTFGRVEDMAPSPPNGVLPVPQLVATLIMRHRERRATRPKRRALGDGPRPQPVSRSPLSRSTSLPLPPIMPITSVLTITPSSGR